MRLSEARDLRWVLPAAAGAFRRQLDALFLAAEVPLPLDVVRCDSLLTTKAIVSGGTHVTILPDDVVAAECASGTLRAIPLVDAPVNRTIGVRRLAGAPQSAAADAIVAAMRALQS
jgi:DNA-binding transcriptional LysR family regulator